MGTLRAVKFKLKTSKDFRKTLVKGPRNVILIDLDGDKEADIALSDDNKDGNIDTISIDLTGNGEFDLVLVDSDNNNIADRILFDIDGTGELTEVFAGKEVEEALVEALQNVAAVVEFADYAADVIDERLEELEKEIKKARKQLRK